MLPSTSIRIQLTEQYLTSGVPQLSQHRQQVDIVLNSSHKGLPPSSGYTVVVNQLASLTGFRKHTFCFLRRHSVHDFASRRRVRLTTGACCITISDRGDLSTGILNSYRDHISAACVKGGSKSVCSRKRNPRSRTPGAEAGILRCPISGRRCLRHHYHFQPNSETVH